MRRGGTTNGHFISIFAGAVWQRGGYVLEEYSETKRGKKGPFPGRIDLEFSAGRHKFLAEVKHCWLSGNMCRDRTVHVRKNMDKAKADVRRCRASGTRRLGIVFGAPYLAQSRKAEMSDRIAWLVDQAKKIKSEIEADAVAWIFSSAPRLPASRGLVHPGIIVWIKEVRR